MTDTPESKALAEALRRLPVEHKRYPECRVYFDGPCDCGVDEKLAAVIACACAAERARFAASVAPMTMTAERHAQLLSLLPRDASSGEYWNLRAAEWQDEATALCAALAESREAFIGVLHAPGCASAPHAEGEMVRAKCDCGERLIAEREAHERTLMEHHDQGLAETMKIIEGLAPDAMTDALRAEVSRLTAERDEARAKSALDMSQCDRATEEMLRLTGEVERLRGERERLIAAGNELEDALDAGTLDGCDLCGGEYHEETCVIAKWRACLPPTATEHGDHERGSE